MQGIGYRRYIMVSGGAHALLIGGLLGLSMAHGCAHAPNSDGQTHELIVDIPDLGQQDPTPTPAPAPAPKPEVKPEPKPQETTPEAPPTKDDIVLPTKEKKKEVKTPDSKPKIEISKQLVRRSLPKPTTTRRSNLTPEEIAIALKRGAKIGAHPTLSDSDVRALLATDMKFGKGDPVTQDDAYNELVRKILYRAWDQPGSLGVVGLKVHVQLTVAPDGRIVASRLVSGSGNSVMDNSVMQAVRSVSRLNGVPGEYFSRHHTITVAFELTGDG